MFKFLSINTIIKIVNNLYIICTMSQNLMKLNEMTYKLKS